MRQKKNLNLPPTILFLLDWIYSYHFYILLPRQHRGTENLDCSTPCHSFLFVLPPCSSGRSHPQDMVLHNLSNVGHSHRHFFKKCYIKGPFYRVLSFRYRGNRSCQKVLSSSIGFRSCQELALVLAFHGFQVPSGHIQNLQVTICSTICWGQAASP